jgi:hypothetical protein
LNMKVLLFTTVHRTRQRCDEICNSRQTGCWSNAFEHQFNCTIRMPAWICFNLASRLGKRIQIRTKKFDEMHTLLRALLPAENCRRTRWRRTIAGKFHVSGTEPCIWSFIYRLNAFPIIAESLRNIFIIHLAMPGILYPAFCRAI